MTSSPTPLSRRWSGIQCIGRGLLVAAFSLPGFATDRAALCESCHGAGGNSTTALIPSIAGQPVTFLENQLIFFREELRRAPVMTPLMNGVADAEITALARHFSRQEVKPATSAPADAALVAKGKEIAAAHHCGQCHLPNYRGRDQMPRLAGQREDYLVAEMIAYRDGKRTGADTTMAGVLNGMSDGDITALAAFVARLPP
jgi:cytochrome c553